MSVILRRSKTVCDVRPSVEINGDKKRKKGIFGKIFRSFAKLGKKKQFQSTSNLDSIKFASVAGSDSGVGSNSAYYNLPGTSFADPPREHHHGSDSASTGYVSEGSSRRTANGRFSVDLEKENKLAKRAHARFRSDDSETSDFPHRLATRSNINVFTLRASDTDLDRDETDLNTDEERDSSVYTDDESHEESYSDSFYSSESSSTTSEDDNSQRGRKRNSEKRKKPSKENSPVRRVSQNRNMPKRSRSALPTIQRTVSANICYSPNIRDYKPSPSAPSPALRARILRLELGETIPTEDEHKFKNDLSPPGGAVRNIAAKFRAKSEAKIDLDTDEKSSEETLSALGRSKSVISPPIVASGVTRTKRNPVLEKFAPKLELEKAEDDQPSKEEKRESQPVSLRRTQSTKVLDLAATLFRPGEEITTESETQKHPPRRNAPARSQTMKLTSPKSAIRRQSNDSFIRELLDLAKSDSKEPINAEPKNMNDFKSQISMASTKIIRRKTMTSADDVERAKITALTKTRAHSCVTSQNPLFKKSSGEVKTQVTAELDPFVEDILNNKTVPQAVKQKIREECWSLFNDPKTPKGVKQCILNTMMTKSQTE
jgi:hypothetical protein